MQKQKLEMKRLPYMLLEQLSSHGQALQNHLRPQIQLFCLS